jgi:hypothetical protein
MVMVGLAMTPKGLFNSLIAFVCTLFSIMIAFGNYELLHRWLLAGKYPDIGLPVALISIFVVTLLILQLSADRFIKRNVLFGSVMETIGSLILSLGAAYLSFGVVAFAWQMMPFGYPDKALGFARYDVDEKIVGAKPGPNEAGLWLQPDRAVSEVVAFLSSGSMSGRQAFADVHPDLVDEVDALSVAVQRESRHYAPPPPEAKLFESGVEFADLPSFHSILTGPNGETIASQEGHVFLVLHVALPDHLRDPEYLPTDEWSLRFTPLSFRLVASRESDSGERQTKHYWATYVMDPLNRPSMVRTKRSMKIAHKKGSGNKYCLVFELSTRDTPRFIEFKGTARSELDTIDNAFNDAGPPSVPSYALAYGKPQGSRSTGQGGSDRPSGFIINARYGEKLPFEIGAGAVTPAKGRKSKDPTKLGASFVHGQRDIVAGKGNPVTEFFLPRGRRILQIDVDPHGLSAPLSRDFLGGIPKRVYVRTDKGAPVPAIGGYFIVQQGKVQLIELVYSPDGAPNQYFPGGGAIRPMKLSGADPSIKLIRVGYIFSIPFGTNAMKLQITSGMKTDEQALSF